jgi:hypothetical protein
VTLMGVKVLGLCERGELSGSIQCDEFLDYLSDY